MSNFTKHFSCPRPPARTMQVILSRSADAAASIEIYSRPAGVEQFTGAEQPSGSWTLHTSAKVCPQRDGDGLAPILGAKIDRRRSRLDLGDALGPGLLLETARKWRRLWCFFSTHLTVVALQRRCVGQSPGSRDARTRVRDLSIPSGTSGRLPTDYCGWGSYSSDRKWPTGYLYPDSHRPGPGLRSVRARICGVTPICKSARPIRSAERSGCSMMRGRWWSRLREYASIVWGMIINVRSKRIWTIGFMNCNGSARNVRRQCGRRDKKSRKAVRHLAEDAG